VKFFVASGLPIGTLKQVWALASNGQKEMGPREFSTAMRLIALAQAGHPISEETLRQTEAVFCSPPKFQNVEISLPSTPTSTSQSSTPPPPAGGPSTPTTWAIPPEQRSGYEKLWGTLQKNAQGMLEGKDAAAFFAKSGQNRDTLRNVWQLADVGGDGMMDQTEFFIGMHLTMMAKKGATLPPTLPQDLLRSASSPMERGNSNVSMSASMMMANMATTSMLGESEKDLTSSRLQKQASSKGSADLSTSGFPPMPPPAAMQPAGNDDYDSLRQDASALNNSMTFAVSRMEDSRAAVKSQTIRAGNELGALRAERERLMQALTEATNGFQSDMEKLRQLDEELVQMRDELARLRQGVDAKRAAVGAQQELIGARLDETRALQKQMMNASLGGMEAQAGQKRRAAPIPPPSDFSQNSGFPSGDSSAQPMGGNAFDQFDDPYATQGSGGKSNEY
jgi:hypothetical protein